MLRTICIVITSLILSLNGIAQNLIYDGYKGDDHIGTMTVTRKKSGNNWIYTSDAQVKISFVLTFELRFVYEAVFKDGKLVSSWIKNYRDGKLTDHSMGELLGPDFHITHNGDKKVIHKADIDYCILKSYFEEPAGRDQIFSERWGEYIPAKRVTNGKYQVVLPNGNTNYFIYKGGTCEELELNHMLASVRFVLRKP